MIHPEPRNKPMTSRLLPVRQPRLDTLVDHLARGVGWEGAHAKDAIRQAILGNDFALRAIPGGDQLAESHVMAIARLSYTAGNLGEDMRAALTRLPRRSRKEIE